MDTSKTRNFALIGHAADGKTTLGEAVLHQAGATSAAGDVTQGTSVLNTLPEEREGHHHTITSHLFSFNHDGYHLTLVDTPGHANFQGDGRVALQALDGAVLVVSSVDGPKVGTDKMLGCADGLSTLAFANAMDHERADFDGTLKALAASSDRRPVPLAIPIGTGTSFEGCFNLVSQKAYTAAGIGEAPADLADEIETRRLELVEAVAECDDELLEKYLEEGELDEADFERGLIAGTRSGQLLPVIAGSALNELGARALLDAITHLLPSPVDRGEWSATGLDRESIAKATPDPSGPLAAVVFKTMIDRYAGTLSVFRVVSGTLKSDSSVLNATTGEKVRIGKLFRLQGEKHDDTSEVGPGEIAAVAKVKGIHTADVLTSEKGSIVLPSPTIPQGVLSYAISARSQGDEDKVYASLARLVEEDPTLSLGREPSTGEFLLTGMGELHIRTTVHKLSRMFDCEVDLKTPMVPYRETILGRAENVEGKLKKQSGGKGMFGVCFLNVEPNPRGAGIEFVDKIVGGSIPRSLIPAVEKGIVEASAVGPLAGYPVVARKLTCIDGKHHSVDSNEMAFKLAGSFGFKAGLVKSKPVLLEPVMDAEITVPDESVGDIMGDISGRRGRVQSSESKGSATVITAQVPMSEMLEYASILTSLTGGKGDFHMEFSHYDPCPKDVQDKVIAKSASAKGKVD